MDDFYLPARFKGLTEANLRAHLRYCASNLQDGDRVEILLRDAGVVIPMYMRIYRRKAPTMTFLVRSGSMGRDHLTVLRGRFESEGYTMKVSVTRKRRLISRLAISLPATDPLFPHAGTLLLEKIAAQLACPWPGRLWIGYRLGSESKRLPGRLSYFHWIAAVNHASYKLGLTLGRIYYKITS